MAFPGDRPGQSDDGATIYLDVAEMRRSVNYLLLGAGWVYPTFYSKLYVDLCGALADTAAARGAGRGLWQRDATLHGFTLMSRDQLRDELVIMPKLFRRLAEYLSLDDTGGVALTGFATFLAAHNDRLYTVPAGQSTSLDTLIEVHDQTVQLTIPPEQIIFVEA